jgi:probable HAF family extracellular repeat protein
MTSALNLRICWLAACAVLFGNALNAQAPQYSIVDLGTIGVGDSQAYSINNYGQVTGYFYDASVNLNRAFLYSDGIMSDLGALAGKESSGRGINDLAHVTGYFQINGRNHAFAYANGAVLDLGTLGGGASAGDAINESGEIAGSSFLADDTTQHAFLYSNGQMRDLGTLGGNSSIGFAINNLGEVTGFAGKTDGVSHAFLYSKGQMIDLGTLGGVGSTGTGINDRGQVTGYSDVSGSSLLHAFLCSDGQMTDLGTLNGNETIAFSINNSGQVVGNWRTAGFTENGFLYSGGRMYDLNAIAQPSGGITHIQLVPVGRSINDRGQIACTGKIGVSTHALLLTPKPQLTSISKSPVDGHIRLTGFGLTAQNYSVEAAPTPNGPWDKIGTVTTNEDGTFQFSDSTSATTRFYRLTYDNSLHITHHEPPAERLTPASLFRTLSSRHCVRESR